MKFRRFFALLIIIIMAARLRLPDFFRSIELYLEDIPAELSINTKAADVEVQSIEEFEAVIQAAISEVKDSIKVRIVGYDEETFDVNTIFKKVLEENVGLGFVSGCNASISKTLGNGAAIVELELLYTYSGEKVAAMREAADSKANDIIENIIEHGMNDYEKVLAVHDYVIKSSRYDRLNADSDSVPAEEHEAYGVLVDGIGVCDSYAKAVKLLLEKAEVRCILVEGSKAEASGQSSVNADHAWNIVRIDGEYYHVDATWDDVSEEKDSTELVYHHLNLDDEEMQKTHIWDRSKYPLCNSTKYNYFRYNKLIADNQEETLSMLVKAISSGDEKLVVKISDYQSSTYNIEKLIKKAAEKSKLRQGITAKWIINDSLGIVDVEFKY